MAKIADDLEKLKATPDASTRNALALSLSETGKPEVLEVLVELIKRTELKDTRGTLVHCLRFFDYNPHFNLLVELVATGNWEVAHEAFELIDSIDKISGTQVSSASKKFKKCLEINQTEEWQKALLIKLVEMFDK
ncbi:MAG: HEAT repeat domain-containing protein [Alphaproteobacteria bacterium]|nr:HEAT repeat domain-containing protein [Alphaproteobacteria bacterium]